MNYKFEVGNKVRTTCDIYTQYADSINGLREVQDLLAPKGDNFTVNEIDKDDPVNTYRISNFWVAEHEIELVEL